MSTGKNQTGNEKVRLDKWLWAARFFKTRAIAKNAIEGGKVHLNGVRAKPSKEPRVDDIITMRQGWDEKTVVIKALSGNRRGAPEAQLLYEETPESLRKREDAAANRKALKGAVPYTEGRPDKKQRRDLIHFKEVNRQDHEE
ncbi:ribosome-associated heat shock protein Hsp15 [Endozoicomonadaceae bacterium StTr2]